MKDFGALTVNQAFEEKRKPQSSTRSCCSNSLCTVSGGDCDSTLHVHAALIFWVSWAWESQNALPTNRSFQGWGWTCLCYLLSLLRSTTSLRRIRSSTRHRADRGVDVCWCSLALGSWKLSQSVLLGLGELVAVPQSCYVND